MPSGPPFDHEHEDGMAILPGFQSGGRVERTGIALVHEGEFVVPAPGSEAVIAADPGRAGGGQVINYYFPVEVEMIGEIDDAQLHRVTDQIYRELNEALGSRR